MSYEKQFFIEGDPAGKPRAKAARRGNFVTMYAPEDSKGWAKLVALQSKRYAPREPLHGPAGVTFLFIFARPKSHFGRHGLKADAPINHTIKPDRDNLDKLMLDVFTKLGFWKDDCQVAYGSVRKIYTCAPYPKPGCWVQIWSL